MTVTSGLIIDREGGLDDIPLGQNGDIARLANGGYAVIAEATGLGVSVLRIFNAEGVAVRSIGFEGAAPAITGLSDGRIAVGMVVGGSLETHLVSADFLTVTAGGVLLTGESSLAARADGTFVVASKIPFTTDADLRLTLLSASGTVENVIQLDQSVNLDSDDPHVAVLSNGKIVVTNTVTNLTTLASEVRFQIVDPQGGVQTFTIPDSAGAGSENRHARVVATADGFAIVYETNVFGFTKLDIRMRNFDLNGVQTRDQLITNSSFGNTGTDDGFDDTAPEIAIGPDGNIAVTWTRSDGLNTDQMLFVLGSGFEQAVGFNTLDNQQGQPLVTFFGTGQIAAYHFDGTQNALVGEHFSGFRDSFGGNGNDIFTGDDFVDLINGLRGRDRLSGAGGDDTVQGGDGRDILFGNDGNDLLQGEEGVGANRGGDHSDRLFGGNGNDTLEGENGNDRLSGDAGDDKLFGGIGNDLLNGGTQNDTLNGGDGEDTLVGGGGADTLDGGLGVDTVTGGGGADRFLISVATSGNRDVITDFVSGTDVIALDFQTFFVIGSQVDESQLRFGTSAQDNDDFLIYNQATGRLQFDADANGAGLAVVIASLAAGTTLLFTDFEFA